MTGSGDGRWTLPKPWPKNGPGLKVTCATISRTEREAEEAKTREYIKSNGKFNSKWPFLSSKSQMGSARHWQKTGDGGNPASDDRRLICAIDIIVPQFTLKCTQRFW